MFKLVGSLFGAASKLPCSIGEQVVEPSGAFLWSLHDGVLKADNAPCSVFVFEAKNNPSSEAPELAKHMVSKLRTTRHPNVLKFIDAVDAGDTVYVVTERVLPLSKVWEASMSKDSICWGLHQLMTALDFLNSTCSLVHGSVSLHTVFVTPALDWKLGGFELCRAPREFRQMNSTPIHLEMKAPEVQECQWSAIGNANPWAVDAFYLGCLMAAVLGDGQVPTSEQMVRSARVPDQFRRVIHALTSDLQMRPNPGELAQNPLFVNSYGKLLCFVEELNAKSETEKREFYIRLPELLEQTELPSQVAKFKLVPALRTALELDNANAGIALGPLLRIGSELDAEDFDRELSPFIVKMFSVNDRATRMELLQRFDVYEKHLKPSLMNDQIFPQLANGFMDASAPLRELTVKAMLHVVPKVKPKTVQQVIRYFAKLQLDPEPGIRTNTTICLGKLASHIPESDHSRVLIPAFSRALKDPFPPARIAGLLTLTATQSLQSPEDVAAKALPAVAPLLLDPNSDVRQHAMQCLQAMISSIGEIADKMAGCDTEEEAAAITKVPPARADAEAENGAGGVSSSPLKDNKAGALLGWAVSSIKSKISTKIGTSSSTGASGSSSGTGGDTTSSQGASSSYEPPSAPQVSSAPPRSSTSAASGMGSTSGADSGAGGDDNWLDSLRNDTTDSSATASKPPAGIKQSKLAPKPAKAGGMKLSGRKQSQDKPSLPTMPAPSISNGSPHVNKKGQRIDRNGSDGSLTGGIPPKISLTRVSSPDMGSGSRGTESNNDWGEFDDFPDIAGPGSAADSTQASKDGWGDGWGDGPTATNKARTASKASVDDEWGFGGGSAPATAAKPQADDGWGFDSTPTVGGGGKVLQPTKAAAADDGWGSFGDEFDPIPKTKKPAAKPAQGDDWGFGDDNW